MKIQVYVISIVLILFYSCGGGQSKQEANSDGEIIVDEVNDNRQDILSFEWQSDMCFNKGYYLSSKYTEKEIKDTHDLWMKAVQLFSTNTTAFRPESIDQLDTLKLIKEYNEIANFLNNCKPVDTPFWNDLVASEKKVKEKEFYLEKLKMQAYENPSVLLVNKYSKPDCDKYLNALTSDDEQLLLDTWMQWAKEKAIKDNNSMLIGRTEENYQSPQRLIYARIDLITFGWWNCMNQYIDRADYTKLQNEFDKMFIRVERDCEEP